jgi:hypothetical protein
LTLVSRFELILLLLAVVIGLELLARRMRMLPAAAFILRRVARIGQRALLAHPCLQLAKGDIGALEEGSGF